MRAEDRALARRQLDKRLAEIRELGAFSRPSRGWIKAIREALGMTTAQLARRLGVSQPRVTAMEKGEIQGSLTLESLEKAAHAMDCRFVYALVPRKPLVDTVSEQAQRKARNKLASTSHSMVLEAQGVDRETETEQVERLARQLQAKAGAALWDDDE
jgi:predicted DNA-binding mobile mystery protein A